MCKISDSLVASISFLPAEQREMVLANFRQSMRDYEGQKIVGYLPRDKSEKHKRIIELSKGGKSNRAIAKIMGCAPKTVRKVVTIWGV
jgi:DNA-binding NarL/FixJ family response regulator